MLADENSEHRVTVTIEIPRWSFVKYAMTEGGGRIEFISPLPCPFNYGYVAGELGGDNLPLDAIVMGRRIGRATEITVPRQATIRFLDDGEVDDKLVCSTAKLTRGQLTVLHLGFWVYVGMKRIVNRLRGRHGRTSFRGIELS